MKNMEGEIFHQLLQKVLGRHYIFTMYIMSSKNAYLCIKKHQCQGNNCDTMLDMIAGQKPMEVGSTTTSSYTDYIGNDA